MKENLAYLSLMADGMNKEQLLKELTFPLSKKKVNQFVLSDLCSAEDLMDLSVYPHRKIAFHAAWVLEYLIYSNPERFKNVYANFLSFYLVQKNLSCQRHFTKILMLLTESSNRHLLENIDLEKLTERTFELLIDTLTPIAVKANCMNILFNMREVFTWITEELKEQVLFLLKNGTPAIQSRGKNILKRLK